MKDDKIVTKIPSHLPKSNPQNGNLIIEETKEEVAEIKEWVDDTRAEVAIERKERKADMEKIDGRMKFLEEKFAGLGGSVGGGVGGGGSGITAVVGDVERKFREMERKDVEQRVREGMAGVEGIKGLRFDGDKNSITLVDFETHEKMRTFLK